jgi:hypothetical protein
MGTFGCVSVKTVVWVKLGKPFLCDWCGPGYPLLVVVCKCFGSPWWCSHWSGEAHIGD